MVTNVTLMAIMQRLAHGKVESTLYLLERPCGYGEKTLQDLSDRSLCGGKDTDIDDSEVTCRRERFPL